MGVVRNILRDLRHIKDLLIVLFAPCVLAPVLTIDDGSQKVKCGYVMLIMAVYWFTEALPISVTALLPVFLFPMLGLAPIKQVAQQYITEMSMILIGVLICAAAIEKWNLHGRIALRILTLVGSEPRWILLGLMLPTWFLSLWICNLAAVGLTIPIGNALIEQLKGSDKLHDVSGHDNNGMELDGVEGQGKKLCNGNYQNGSPVKSCCTRKVTVEPVLDDENEDTPYYKSLRKCMTLGIAYAANTGGIGTMTGAASNMILMGAIEKLYEKYKIADMPLTFATWMGFGIPLSLTLVTVAWCWLQILYLRCRNCRSSPDTERGERVKAFIREEYEKLGPISFGQAAVSLLFVLLGMLWITRDMGGEYGWGHMFQDKYVKDGVASILVAVLLFVFPSEVPRIFCNRPSGVREPMKPLLTWHEAVHRVPWGIIFLLGGGFALAYGSQISGLSAWIGQQLKDLRHLDPWVLILVLCFIVAGLTEVIINAAVVMLMMPILGELAITLHMNPVYLMLPTTIATSFAFMLPAATPPNAVAFSYGAIKVKDMVIAGILLNIVGVLVLVGFTETLGDAIFNFHELPSDLVQYYNQTR